MTSRKKNTKELSSCKMDVSALEYDIFKIYYDSNNISFLNHYKNISQRDKKLLMKQILERWNEKFRNEQIEECLSKLNVDIHLYIDFLNYFSGKDSNIQTDIFMYVNLSTRSQEHLIKYTYLSPQDKLIMIHIEYYLDQTNKIFNINLPLEIWKNILINIDYDSEILLNMALVSKKFYDIVSKILIPIQNKRKCGVCYSDSYMRSIISVICSPNCEKLELNKIECVKLILSNIFNTKIIECISQYILLGNIIRCYTINKKIYNITKTMKMTFPKGKIIDCNGCGKRICISEKYLIGNVELCGECLGNKIYPKGNVPGGNWSKCCLCACMFFIKNDYNGTFQKCLKCRNDFFW